LAELEKTPGENPAKMNEPQKTVAPTINPSDITMPDFPLPRVRIRIALFGILFGFFVLILGARPSWFGVDRSPVVGFVQIAVMLIGLAIICISGYSVVHALWRRRQPSISADIGLRLVSTGYVIVLFSGMADVLGIGSHPLPGLPVFGIWQARGMEIGLAVIAIGFVMMFPYKHKARHEITPTP
jgi:hypothetical protein